MRSVGTVGKKYGVLKILLTSAENACKYFLGSKLLLQ